MVIAALCMIAKRQKQPKCPSIDEWINKMWYMQLTLEQHRIELRGSTYERILFNKCYSITWSKVGCICRCRTMDMEGQPGTLRILVSEAGPGTNSLWILRDDRTYSGILISHKNEWNFDTCYNMYGPWKHYFQWNKPDIKGQRLNDSTYMSYLE